MSRFVLTLFVALAIVSASVMAIGPIECKKPNEEYQCGSACQTTCATLGQVCPIVNIRCNDACYCVKGYARDHSGTCIPISQCPKKPSTLAKIGLSLSNSTKLY